jgi:hypothetical protein
MSSSPTVTLFTQATDSRQPPTSFAASILIHAVVVGVTSFGILYTPRIDTRAAAERLMVHSLSLNMPLAQTPHSSRGAIHYPGPHLNAHLRPSGGKPMAHPPALRVAIHAKPGPQTLVQADLLTHITLKEKIPIPEAMIWTPLTMPVKNIVAPLPSPPTAADVTPSLKAPNQELNLADVEIASSQEPALNQLVLPSTTSPVVVEGPQLAQMAPTTVSQISAQPTPAALLSLSDIHMPVGTVILPPVNETASAGSTGALAPEKTANSAQPGAGNAAGAGNLQAAAAVPTEANAAGAGRGGQGAETEITLPKNGQFGAVVVGDSLEDEFPEMAGVWSGRIAYTVYLHVGLARSWILQYALPSTADAEAGGNIADLEAPWPYNIVRPNLAAGSIDADALMIHGFVNRQGRFDHLSIVFPQAFPQAQFVLDALDRWQFRPASQDGQNARVEILLIIPEELD